MRGAARAVRLATLLAVAAAGLLAGAAGAGFAQAPAPTVSLVAPANGAVVRSSHVTFAWRVDWPRSLPVPASQAPSRQCDR